LEKRVIKLAGAQGYYGDSPEGVGPLLAAEPDFIVCEALSELTLAILQKDRLQDPGLGYTKDLPAYLSRILGAVAESRTKFVTNAGGINPDGAAAVVASTAKEMGFGDLVVATINGSDFGHRLAEFKEASSGFAHIRTEEPCPFDDVAFAAAYLGAFPIAEALEGGADVVITGRVADAALFLGPLIHSFGWSRADVDLLAAGTVVGHLLECSTQVSGGNLSGPWKQIPDPAHIAFPLAEVSGDGTAVITKAEGGGVVSFESVRQQLLYEVGDPKAYLAPDCIADFTSVVLEDLGGNRVSVSGVSGAPATDSYKALICRAGGWLSEAKVGFAWPDALAKARLARDIVLERTASYLGDGDEIWTEFMGASKGGMPGGVLGSASEEELDALENTPLADQPSEVVLRIALRTDDKKTADRFSREFNKLGLSAPPGLFGLGRGGGPSRLLELWPTLVPKELIDEQITVEASKVSEMATR
jgi:hypothetical protein